MKKTKVDEYKLRNEEKDRLLKLCESLCSWYESGHRELPWRKDASPYHVWVSEIMLQQTRVEAVIGYYERFLSALPEICDLASCEDDALMKLWQGLGYYSRVRNLKKAAQIIVEKYEGRLPDDYEKILALPGIGSYTAGAISSIAYGLPYPAVDGNVLRVVSRVMMLYDDIARPDTKKKLEAWLTAVMPKKNPGTFNQALMELGAVVCIPNGAPLCQVCPVKGICLAERKGLTGEIPVKSAARKRRIEERTILLLFDGHGFYLRKRPAQGLLAGLYEPAVLEGYAGREEILSSAASYGIQTEILDELPSSKHIFSHVEWHMKGYLVKTAPLAQFKDQFIGIDEIDSSFAIPSAYAVYVKEMHRITGEIDSK